MTRHLQRLAATPISQRHRTFALVAAALALLAAGLVATAPEPPAPTRRVVATTPRLPDRPAVAPAASPPSEHLVGRAPAVRVARRFLSGYLDYLYGHGTSEDIPVATPALGRRLAEDRPRVSPATRRRHPRIRRLKTEPSPDGSGVRVVGTIADGGVVSYPIAVTLTRQPDGRVLVADVLEAE